MRMASLLILAALAFAVGAAFGYFSREPPPRAT